MSRQVVLSRPGPVRFEIEPILRSRFIGIAEMTSTEDAAQRLLADVRAEFPDASHHCSAWRIASPSIDRCSDDGEPSGSAGRPMLAQLQGRDLVNTAVVVVRWFGGTKLGVGGLVRAYGASAAAVLDSVGTVPWRQMVTATITHGYPDTDTVDRVLTEHGIGAGHVNYGAEVVRSIEVAVDDTVELTAAIIDATAARALVEIDDD